MYWINVLMDISNVWEVETIKILRLLFFMKKPYETYIISWLLYFYILCTTLMSAVHNNYKSALWLFGGRGRGCVFRMWIFHIFLQNFYCVKLCRKNNFLGYEWKCFRNIMQKLCSIDQHEITWIVLILELMWWVCVNLLSPEVTKVNPYVNSC